jgi:hypothetical protein
MIEQIVKALDENRFAWVIELEHGTVLETCAIDALMFLHKTHGDYYTYATYDKFAWVDYQKYEIARRKAINAEFMARYS